MTYMERYKKFKDKQQLIKRLKMVAAGKVASPRKDLQSVLDKVFTDNKIRVGKGGIDTAMDIVSNCKAQDLPAFKAAAEICNELYIEPRFNRTHIEQALLKNQILKN